MAKKSKNPLMVIGVIVVLVLVGVVVLVVAQQKDKSVQNQPATKGECKTIEEKEICTGDYVGLSESEAANKAKSANQVYRIVERDGEGLPINSDRNQYRLNFTVSNDKVIKAEFY